MRVDITCLHMHVWGHMQVDMHMEDTVDIMSLLWLLFTLFIEAASLTKPRAGWKEINLLP